MIGIVQPCKGITKMVTHSNVLYRAVNFAYKRIIAGTEKKQNFNHKDTNLLADRTTSC